MVSYTPVIAVIIAVVLLVVLLSVRASTSRAQTEPYQPPCGSQSLAPAQLEALTKYSKNQVNSQLQAIAKPIKVGGLFEASGLDALKITELKSQGITTARCDSACVCPLPKYLPGAKLANLKGITVRMQAPEVKVKVLGRTLRTAIDVELQDCQASIELDCKGKAAVSAITLGRLGIRQPAQNTTIGRLLSKLVGAEDKLQEMAAKYLVGQVFDLGSQLSVLPGLCTRESS